MPMLASTIERKLRHGGAALWGVADLEPLRERLPTAFGEVPENLNRAVVFAVRMLDEVLETVIDEPTLLYFHHYRQVNYLLDRLALDIGGLMQDAGFRALPIPASQVTARSPMRGFLSHRLLAQAAGLGWIGINNLLVTREWGARVRLVSVLTDAPMSADAPCDDDCGNCTACISVCPAGAIGKSREDFNAEACERRLTEFSKIPFIGQHICGVCVKACRGKHK